MMTPACTQNAAPESKMLVLLPPPSPWHQPLIAVCGTGLLFGRKQPADAGPLGLCQLRMPDIHQEHDTFTPFVAGVALIPAPPKTNIRIGTSNNKTDNGMVNAGPFRTLLSHASERYCGEVALDFVLEGIIEDSQPAGLPLPPFSSHSHSGAIAAFRCLL
jgi:hypothetical protein